MSGFFSQIRDWLWQSDIDTDFRDMMRRRSWSGLRAIGWVMVALPPVISLVVRVVLPEVPAPAGARWLAAAIMIIGVATLGVQRSGWLYEHARALALGVTCVVSYLLVWSSLLRAAEYDVFLYLINAQVTVVVLLAVLAVPLRPLQVLSLGWSATLFYYVSHRLAVSWTLLPDDPGGELNLVFLTVVTVLATVVAGNQYRQIREYYRMYRTQLEASEERRDTQCRMLLSDNAASMGRLAAALSHELNNPLGVLKSTLDTMRSLVIERRHIPPEKQANIDRMKTQLCQNALNSVERLQLMVERMQRFTNLDRAEVLPVDMNQLVRDVADVVEEALERPGRFELSLGTLPDVEVRPQLISAVFSALLHNAAEASPENEAVRVTTRLDGATVCVIIEDRGAGMTPLEAEHAMEPSFRVKGERVAACNWNLFGARQIVREHRGEIELDSQPGRGTKVTVRLPAQRLKV